MPTQRHLAFMRTVRAGWKRDGYCTRCGKGIPAPGYTRCPDCCEADVLRKRKHPLDNVSTAAHPSS